MLYKVHAFKVIINCHILPLCSIIFLCLELYGVEFYGKEISRYYIIILNHVYFSYLCKNSEENDIIKLENK